MKIEQILKQSTKVLSQKQREFYFENGYLLLEKFITGELLDRLQNVTQGFIEKSRRYDSSNEQFDLEPEHSAEDPRVRRLNMPYRQHPTYWELTSNSPITDIQWLSV